MTLSHPDVGESLAEGWGEGVLLLLARAKVCGRVLWFQVSPALKGAAWRGGHANEIFVTGDGAIADAIAPVFVKSDNPLTGEHHALDHPEDAPPIQELILALGPHARDVARVAVIALGAFAGLPVCKAFDGFSANG